MRGFIFLARDFPTSYFCRRAFRQSCQSCVRSTRQYCSALFKWEFFIQMRASCLPLSFHHKRGSTEKGWVQNRPFSFEWKALIWIGHHCRMVCGTEIISNLFCLKRIIWIIKQLGMKVYIHCCSTSINQMPFDYFLKISHNQVIDSSISSNNKNTKLRMCC